MTLRKLSWEVVSHQVEAFFDFRLRRRLERLDHAREEVHQTVSVGEQTTDLDGCLLALGAISRRGGIMTKALEELKDALKQNVHVLLTLQRAPVVLQEVVADVLELDGCK